MPTSIPPLIPGNFYHIYNRGNNHENIFLQERNYSYFLDLWWKHLSPIAETWAYCLLKNHFHAVVYIKEKEDLTGLKRNQTRQESRKEIGYDLGVPHRDLSGHKDPSQYFSNFFNAYARAVNIATKRTGALFERPFKRIPIGKTAYLMQVIIYVHQNPQKHHFVQDFRDWNYSSYHLLISDAPTRLQRDRLMNLFGSRRDFVRIHQEIQPLVELENEK